MYNAMGEGRMQCLPSSVSVAVESAGEKQTVSAHVNGANVFKRK